MSCLELGNRARHIIEEGGDTFARKDYPEATIWRFLAPHYTLATPETRLIAIAGFTLPPSRGNPAAEVEVWQDADTGAHQCLLALWAPAEPHLFWYRGKWYVRDLAQFIANRRKYDHINLEKQL